MAQGRRRGAPAAAAAVAVVLTKMRCEAKHDQADPICYAATTMNPHLLS